MKLLLGFLSFQFLFVCSSYSHVTLTFPPARRFALDFLDDQQTEPPCGFPRDSNSSSTTLIAGTAIKITWNLAYPHMGGIKLEVVEENDFRVAISLLDSQYIFQNNHTLQHATLILPVRYTCDSCVIRLLRQAPEWGSKLLFWSCADVTILPHPDYSYQNCKSGKNSNPTEPGNFTWRSAYYPSNYTEETTTKNTMAATDDTTLQGTITKEQDTTVQSTTNKVQQINTTQQTIYTRQSEKPVTITSRTTACFPGGPLAYSGCYAGKCLNEGVCNGTTGACICPRLFHGGRCEKFDECWSDIDCNHGKCIDTRIESHPRLLCYCQDGWFGIKCNKNRNQNFQNGGVFTHLDVQRGPANWQTSFQDGATSRKNFSFQGSSVELLQDYSNNPEYRTRVIRSDVFTLHWRLLEEEIEVVVQARSLSWVGVGWRPLSLDETCKKFPDVSVNRAEGHNLPTSALGVISDLNFTQRNPSLDPEISIENKLINSLQIECAKNTTDRSSINKAAVLNSRNEPKETIKRSLLLQKKRSFTAMDCSDIVVGSIKGNLHRVQDMYTRDRSSPQPDHFYVGSDSITGAAGSQVDGITTIVFRKRNNSSEPSDHAIKDELMSVIWAMGLEVGSYRLTPPLGLHVCNREENLFYIHDAFKYHGSHPGQRGAIAFNFFDPPTKNPLACKTEASEIRVPRTCTHSNKVFNCVMYLAWKFDATRDVIQLTFKYPHSAGKWFAFGFSKSASMLNSDVIVSWVDPGGARTLQDRWAEDYEMPVIDKTYNLFEEEIEVVGGVVSVKLKRARRTGDSQDAVFSDTQCNFLMLSSGPLNGSNNMMKHDPSPLLTDKQVCIHTCGDERTETTSFTGLLLLRGERFVPALLTPSSRPYKQLKQRMEDLLTQAYLSLNLGYLLRIKVEVTGFKPGSIIVGYIVSAVFDPALTRSLASSVEVNLTAELEKYINENSLHLPGSSYFVAVIRGKDKEEEEKIVAVENRNFQIMMTYLISLFIVVAAIELVKRSAQRRRKHHIIPTTATKAPLDGEVKQQYSDVSVNKIYEEIYDVMKRRHSLTCTINGQTRRVSNAGDLRRLEDAASRHKHIHEPQHFQEWRQGHDAPGNRRFLPTTRPTSAKPYPRRHSNLGRRPQSAKRFDSKSSLDNLMTGSGPNVN